MYLASHIVNEGYMYLGILRYIDRPHLIDLSLHVVKGNKGY